MSCILQNFILQQKSMQSKITFSLKKKCSFKIAAHYALSIIVNVHIYFNCNFRMMATCKELNQKTALESQGLHSASNPFRALYELMFCGPLKGNSMKQPCNSMYLMLWIGEKGSIIYSSRSLQGDDKKTQKNVFVLLKNIA